MPVSRKFFPFIFLFIIFALDAVARQMPFERDDLLEHLAGEPAFAYRGVVEGFYGRPWTHEERKDMIRFMGAVRMNAYFYAPKDDPYHRQRWREPYSGADRIRFQELVTVAGESDVDLYFAIHPGLSIEYSSESDYEALISKLDDMRELGVRHFALFVDDVPLTLQHESDKARFEDLAEAHVYLINRLHGDLQERGTSLVVCPTTYTNAFGHREYVRKLGDGIPQEIPLFWTGVDLAPPEITREQAADWGELMSRRPLIWDNFPVNDYDTWRPFVGPLYGRAADLDRAAIGIIANPMSEVYASMLPLYTVAEYAWDPSAYDPDAAIARALEKLVGPEGQSHAEVFVEVYRPAGWDDNVFTPLVTPGVPLHGPTVRDAIARLQSALSGLVETPARDNISARLADDLGPYVRTADSLLAQIEANPAYERRDDGHIVYRDDWEILLSRPAPFDVVIDGDLSNWEGQAFYDLKPAAASRFDGTVKTAFLHDDEYLYVAARVEDGDLRPRADVFYGDHLTLAIDNDPEATTRHLKPQDLLMLIPAPGDDGTEIGADFREMHLSRFAARGIADIHFPALSSFFYQFSRDARASQADLVEGIRWASRRTEDGYAVEIAVPRDGRDVYRLNLTHVDIDLVDGSTRRVTSTLSARPYLGNPTTYPTLRLLHDQTE